MIQELLGGSNVGIINNGGGGERSKLACGGVFDGPPSHHNSPSLSPSPSSGVPAAAAQENLRCPRCDSSNTKFCYYNNYNLTQPRHFCKTCRRYWTKGGALRNVPIGGGCRKNKTTAITAAVGKPSAAGKLKTLSSEMAKTGGLFSGFDHAEALSVSANPMLWASSQNSHLLSLLRTNPSHLQNSLSSMKEEGALFGSSHLNSEPSVGANFRASSGLDHFSPAHLPSMALSNSLYRSQSPSGQGMIIQGEVQNHGLQELYQRLRSSSSGCYPEHAPVVLGSMASSAAILDSAPVATGELGFWNPNLSWPATNGAYP